MAIARFKKDPDATLDYSFSWKKWLNGDTIIDSEWIVEPGVTLEDETGSEVIRTAWVSGGTVGESYELTNRITTAGGRIDDRTLILDCEER